jgi:hypothetical protein
MSSHAASGARPRARRVSQVPRPICHCAPSAPTPAGRSGAYADGFPARAGFSISGSLATCTLRIEADLGSTFDGLRLTASLSTAFGRFARCPPRTGLAPRASLPPRDRPQLHVSSALHMAVTSQTARRARLVLAHQRRKGAEKERPGARRHPTAASLAPASPAVALRPEGPARPTAPAASCPPQATRRPQADAPQRIWRTGQGANGCPRWARAL